MHTLVVGLTAVVLLAAASFANAASLQVQSGTLGAQVSGHPCSGQATATAATGSGTTYSAVRITVPPGCANRRLDVTLLNGSTVLRSGNANVAGSGATTVTFTGTYTATSSLTVQAIVDGWSLPTTTSWSTSFTLPSGAKITNLWNGALAGSGSPYTVANLSYNGAVAAGRSTSYGFTGSGPMPRRLSR